MTSTPYVTTKRTSQAGIYTLTFNTPLASLAAADFITSYTINHAFKVLDIRSNPTVAATTAAKAATLTVKVDGVAVPGAALAMTSANQTPIGKVTTATATDLAPNGLNTGAAGSAISITGSAVTAFVEGSSTISVTLQNLEDA
jgi:hypothetical protein